MDTLEEEDEKVDTLEEEYEKVDTLEDEDEKVDTLEEEYLVFIVITRRYGLLRRYGRGLFLPMLKNE